MATPVAAIARRSGVEVNWTISVVNKQALIERLLFFFRLGFTSGSRAVRRDEAPGQQTFVDFSDAISFPLLSGVVGSPCKFLEE